jgi:L-amino acid N-acyltransferase YncA
LKFTAPPSKILPFLLNSWLVCEQDGRMAGYAYAGPYRSRCAYSWSVESTVYVHREFQGKGIGKKLYRQLFEILKGQGVVNVIAGITLPNEASVGLHESLKFEKVAEFKDVGFKLGHWWAVGFWQLQLQKPDRPKDLGQYVCSSTL